MAFGTLKLMVGSLKVHASFDYLFYWTIIFEWYVRSEHGHQKDMLKEIGLHM
jgi:hypothetical protein